MIKSKNIQFCLQELPFQNSIDNVQLIRVGNFNHYDFGKFDITSDILRDFKLNFDRKARRVDLAVDYFHESFAEAAGWIRSVDLQNNDTELWINVEWTEKAKEKILGREIRYISAEFDLEYIDSETEEKYGATLFGAGLTNRPHVKGMQPIFSESTEDLTISKKNKGIEMNDLKFEDILALVNDFSEDEKLQLGEKLGFTTRTSDIDNVNVKLSEVESQLSIKDNVVTKLSEQVKKLQDSLNKKEKEIEFTSLLSKGAVVEAQRAAFMEGDFKKFAENAVSIKLEEKGSGEESEALSEDKALKILREKVKILQEAEGLDYLKAKNKVLAEDKKLAKAFNL